MFVFGCPIASERKYSSYAGPSIAAVREPDSRVYELRDQDSIFTAYNDVLALAAADPELEGVVLMHEDLEIADPGFLDKLRAELADPDVWIVGAIGGRGVTKPAWWACYEWIGHVFWNNNPGAERSRDVERFKVVASGRYPESAEVDMLDGLLLVLSPEAARTIAFDESLGPGFHLYDSDICLQARSRGKKVRTAPLALVHHTSGDLSDPPAYARAHAKLAAKWGL